MAIQCKLAMAFSQLFSLPHQQHPSTFSSCNASPKLLKPKKTKTAKIPNNPTQFNWHRNKQQTPQFITPPLTPSTEECKSTAQKSKRLRTSNYVKTLSSIYADMNDLCREGFLSEALKALDNPHFRGGIPPDGNMYEILLQACTKFKALEQGKQVHVHMKLTRLDRYEFLRTRLVKMYVICGSIEDACEVFDKSPRPKCLGLWNAMIRGWVIKGFCEGEVIRVYREMRVAGVEGDRSTFSLVLKACGVLLDLKQGREVHQDVVGSRVGRGDIVVWTALVDMYLRCGSVEDACTVFDEMPQRNVITWSAMIVGLVHIGLWEEALGYFRRMLMEGERPNSVTLSAVLPAYGKTGDLQHGKEIHGYAIRNGFDAYAFVDNGVVAMYANCCKVEDARVVFDDMVERNVASYSTMILGYAQNGYANEALEVFCQIGLNDVKANTVAVANVLPACGDVAALQKGKEIHAYIIRCGFEVNAFVCCALMDMYSKCGRIEVARNVFDSISKRDVASWTAIIAGYGINGDAKESLDLFSQMRQAELEPDCNTFLAVLDACNQANLVYEGRQIFQSMRQYYHITPAVEHYACMVDLLGRAGFLNEASGLVLNMPVEPDVSIWGALLSACRIYCTLDIEEHNALFCTLNIEEHNSLLS